MVCGLFDQLTEDLEQMKVLRSYLRLQTMGGKQQNLIGLATTHDGNLPHLLGVSNLGRFAGFPKDNKPSLIKKAPFHVTQLQVSSFSSFIIFTLFTERKQLNIT